MSEEQIPPFPDELWEKQMQSAYGPGGPSAATAVLDKSEEETSLARALGEPEEMVDLWPGHAYRMPISKLGAALKMAEEVAELYNADKIAESAMKACELIAAVSCRIEGFEYIPVTVEEVADELDEDEAGHIVHHILMRQGLKETGKPGNAVRPTGWKSFQRSAGYTISPPEIGETLPSPSSEE